MSFVVIFVLTLHVVIKLESMLLDLLGVGGDRRVYVCMLPDGYVCA